MSNLIEWYRTAFLYKGMSRGDFPCLVDPERNANKACTGQWNGYEHRAVIRKRPAEVAWTGNKIKSDFFLIEPELLLVSERGRDALNAADVRGFDSGKVLHKGIAMLDDMGHFTKLKSGILQKTALGFSQLTIEHFPTFDQPGIEVETCPECGLQILITDPPVPCVNLEFPTSLDIVKLPSYIGSFFSSSRFQEIVQRDSLRGVAFFEIRDLYGELSRDSSPEWLVECRHSFDK